MAMFFRVKTRRSAIVWTKAIPLLAVTAFLLLIRPIQRLQSEYYDRISARLQIEYGNQEHSGLNSSHWGLLGNHVKQLGRWAAALEEYPHVDEKPLTDALISLFPWLEGSENHLYIPWASRRAGHHAAPLQTGIVICAGSTNFHLAAHLVVSLRRVHMCNLPIEIAYAGDDDLKPHHAEYLQSIAPDVFLVNLLDIFPRASQDLPRSWWAMKPFALLASRFPRAILADADALFLTTPDDLFTTHPGLIKTGTLFYHDRIIPGRTDTRQTFLQAKLDEAAITPSAYLQNESLMYANMTAFEADSGVVCLDKSRPQVFLGLVFATWMNTKKVREEVSYVVYYGDKETFWIAMELSGVEYFFQSRYAGTIGTIEGGLPAHLETTPTEICGTHMLHMDHSHTTPFWINGGVYHQKRIVQDGYAQLTHYWPGDVDPGAFPRWRMYKLNVACIRTTGVRAIDFPIQETWSKIIHEVAIVDNSTRQLAQ